MAFNKDRNFNGTKTYDVLTPLHEIDSLNGEEMKKYVVSSLGSTDIIIINFSKVAYINSSGLRELIQILKLSRDGGKPLYLVEVPEDIHKIFIHSNLDRLFTFCDTLDCALNTIS